MGYEYEQLQWNVAYLNKSRVADSTKWIPAKRKRPVLSVNQKLENCKQLKKGASITSLSKELGLGKSTICNIKRNEDKLVTFVEKLDSTKASTTRKTMKAAKDKKLDEAVAMWLCKTFRRSSYIWTNSNGKGFAMSHETIPRQW